MSSEHRLPRGIKHISTLSAVGLILALISLAGLIYSSTGNVLFGPDTAYVLDSALIVGTLLLCATVIILTVDYH